MASRAIKTIQALKDVVIQPDVFIRWSRGPTMDKKQGNSRDYVAGHAHAGLSAVPADPDWATDDKWLARRVVEYQFLRLKDRQIGCHIYRAEQVGIDSDGYALITNIKPLGQLSDSLIQELTAIRKAQ